MGRGFPSCQKVLKYLKNIPSGLERICIFFIQLKGKVMVFVKEEVLHIKIEGAFELDTCDLQYLKGHYIKAIYRI